MPFLRLATLKQHSISIRSALSFAIVSTSFLLAFASEEGLTSFGPLIRIAFFWQNSKFALVL